MPTAPDSSADGGRPLFSICIPAYNRARFLGPLLDSVLRQECRDFEIVICEDMSPEREQVRSIAEQYNARDGDIAIRYIENPRNLGYDGNIRQLVKEARGHYCFFMGNDDLMRPGALATVAGAIGMFPDTGFVLKGYAWFEGEPSNVCGTVRYVTAASVLEPGPSTVAFCFRRCGVISGFIIHRDLADSFGTDEFDGTLYYQMYIAGRVLLRMGAVAVPDVLILARGDQPPEFGSSESEKKDFMPGRYTAHARITMLKGMLRIAKAIEDQGRGSVYDAIVRDMSAHFYPYLKDQLGLSLAEYWKYYRTNVRLGFGRTAYFHVYFLLVRIIGCRGFDWLIQRIRDFLGRTPTLG